MNTLSAAHRRHPLADRPLIDFNLVMIFEPTTMAGAVVGAYINKITPPVVVTILLVLVLSMMAQRTLAKGFKTFRKEGGFAGKKPPTEGEKKQLLDGGEKTDSNGGEIRNAFYSNDTGPSGLTRFEEGRLLDAKDSVNKILESDRRVKYWKPLALATCFLGVMVLEIFKGGGGWNPLGVQCGSLAFWILSVSTIPWVIMYFLGFRHYLLKDYKDRIYYHFPHVEGDIVWDEKSTVKYPLICTIAGLFAGLFGVGGGIVKGPLMLEMGVLPPVAAASVATMILFTSAAATVGFWIFGMIPLDYGAVAFVVGVVCNLAGQYITKVKSKRDSFIIFSIGFVIGFSAVLMAVESITALLADPSQALVVHSICSGNEVVRRRGDT